MFSGFISSKAGKIVCPKILPQRAAMVKTLFPKPRLLGEHFIGFTPLFQKSQAAFFFEINEKSFF